MNNCAELNRIRRDYGCKGEIIFRTAITMVVENGQNTFKDETWFEDQINFIDERHDAAEAVGKHLVITREFEKTLMECAKEIAMINTMDLLQYIQTAVYFGGDGIDYKRTIDLLKKCMECICENTEGCKETLWAFESLGLTDDEIEEFGYGYLLSYIDEEDE